MNKSTAYVVVFEDGEEIDKLSFPDFETAAEQACLMQCYGVDCYAEGN